MDTQLAQEMSKIKWFHRIDLGDGIVTPGVDDTPAKLKTIAMPTDLSGKTVLDVGAWDGFFSFEAEKRGARRVLATDSYVWRGKGWADKRGFNLAKRALNSKVREKTIDVLDLSPKTVGKFDLVLFLGVLYHMRDPISAIERIASVTKDHLILETFTDLMNIKRPAIALYREGDCEGDKTTWCGPNTEAVKVMLEQAGFRRTKLVYSHPAWFRTGRAVKLMKKGMSLSETIQQSRIVIHAWK